MAAPATRGADQAHAAHRELGDVPVVRDAVVAKNVAEVQCFWTPEGTRSGIFASIGRSRQRQAGSRPTRGRRA